MTLLQLQNLVYIYCYLKKHYILIMNEYHNSDTQKKERRDL